jgi:hypothetical protein
VAEREEFLDKINKNQKIPGSLPSPGRLLKTPYRVRVRRKRYFHRKIKFDERDIFTEKLNSTNSNIFTEKLNSTKEIFSPKN